MADKGEILDHQVIKESTNRFPCPSCGANITFDPDSQSLVCPYCTTKIDIIKKCDNIEEYCFFSALEHTKKGWGEEKRIMHCDSCGADTVLNKDSTSQFCPFCGSSRIVKDIEKAGIAPESLVPFKLTKNKAMDCFKKWMSKRYFAPRALKKEYDTQNLNGVYLPFWTYDSDTYSTYKGEGGTYYYVTETYWTTANGKRQMQTRQVRKIRWWPTSGDYKEYFDDVLVNGSDHVDKTLIKKVEPFNLKELVHYKPEFLSGFLAERYSIDLEKGWTEAKKYVDREIVEGVKRKINADEVRNLRVNTKYNDIKYKHLLLPVWISSYKYRGKIYQFMINGQTGEVQGQAPVSPWKVAGAVLAFAAGAWALVQVLTVVASRM